MEIWGWQAAFGMILVALFYREQLTGWIVALARQNSGFGLGYVFATGYALLAILVVDVTFTLHPLPRFDDIFLVGIALTAYFFNSKPAAYLLLIGILVSAWVLPPADSFKIAEPVDWYRVSSFAAVSVLLMCIITQLKSEARRRSMFRLGYLFASAYLVGATMVAVIAFGSHPPPRFTDLFLVGIAATAYFLNFAQAAYLLAISVGVSAWILPPGGSFAIADPVDCYRLFSFTLVSGLLILITSRLKKGALKTAVF